MKKKLLKNLSASILAVTILFFSCEKNDLNIDEHSHVDKNKISFKEFLNKTQIENFSFQINTNTNSNQSIANRQSNDFIAFVVDTTLVKQRIQASGNYTFTLPVIPVPYQNTKNLFYNIVFYKANSVWQWSVLEYQKDNNNEFDVQEIVNDFNHNGLVNMRLQGVWSTTYTFNCVGCKGTCDLCPLCVSSTTTYDLAILDDPTSKFEVIEDVGNNGGASSVNVGMALADNFANTQLTPEQKLIYDLNPSIAEYLANNVIVVPHPNYNPVLGGEPNMAIINPEAEQFVIELIDFVSQNPISNSYIVNYLNEVNWSDESLEFIQELMNGLINNPQPIYTITDYPGKNDGMPFEWWIDRNFIIDNLKIKNESNTLEGDPNEREILLFILYPAQALLHIKNSNFAIEKSVELVNNNILTRIHNGKADAFRHAYWNAFDTAQFGSYVTKLFTDAHEWNSGNQPLESQMDFYNNQIGRNVGENLSFYSTPDLVKFTILNEIEEGRLKYLTPLANHDGNNILPNTLLKFTNQ